MTLSSLFAPAAPDAVISAYISSATAKAWQVDGLREGTPTRKVAKVGIIGAGTMGGGISMNFANAGIPVTIVETKQEALDRGLSVIKGNYERSAARGRFPMDEVPMRMSRLTGSLSMDDLKDCDLIIEAVFEDMDLKKQIFTKLDAIAKPGAILASNTSALDINEIASVTKRPQDVIGLHFFSPANVMKLLEIVRGARTADDVIATSMAVAKTIDKVAVLVGVCPGFVGNRMLYARGAQLHPLLAAGAMPWDIDAAINKFGFKMGPFQMSDLAGLDIGWKKGAKTANPLRDALCELDRRGQKTNAGYYDYDAERRPTPSPVVEKIIRDYLAGIGAKPRPISEEDIVTYCIFPMINEGAKILEEGMAQRASDIDVVWLNGYGWPADKGGPMFYGDKLGLDRVVKGLEKINAESPVKVSLSPLLTKLASGGKTFIAA
ncbi:MAG: 3-hydroxyacyl-CoA dehydrogenase [Alphaproteobacteria bacterium]|nr:3-hydroxyacyl-CoA dehydrogenase [Alphaproteobacteria bacterium]